MAAAAFHSRPFAWVLERLERLDHEPPDLLRVLTYHRVVDPASRSAPPGIGIPAPAFAEQMRYLKARCRVVSVHEVLDAVRSGTRLPRRAVLVTFDDGYRDFRLEAWPILKGLGLPATLFVPTAFPGDPQRRFWWDELHHALMNTPRRDVLEATVGRFRLEAPAGRRDAYARLRNAAKRMPHAEALRWVAAICRDLAVPPAASEVLGWDELRELSRAGVAIGSHTRTHPLLTRLPIEEGRAEVKGSLGDLERELGSALPILAYPAGGFDGRVVRMLAEEGVMLGFTAVPGINALRSAHPLMLRRIAVGSRSGLPLVRAQLAARSLGLNRLHPLREPVPPEGGARW